MFSQDILMRELMQFVRQILATVMGLIGEGRLLQAHQTIGNASEKVLKLPLEDLLKLSNEELSAKVEKEEWAIEKIEVAAELILAQGKIKKAEKELDFARDCFTKAEFLYQFLSQKGEVYSMDWGARISEIEALLNNLDG